MRAESEFQSFSESSSRLRFDPSSVAYTFQSEQLEQRHIFHLLDQGLYDQQARLLNKRGAQMLQEGLYDKAKPFLETAQKILQSAASSGRIVDHSLVISVLHNLACYHQLTWNLECCANYIEALLFNLNSELQAINGASLAAQQSSGLTCELSLYYLRFCAVNSQLKRHDAALISAKKASSLLRISVQQLMRMVEGSHLSVQARSRQILLQLSYLKGNTDGLQIQDLLFMAKRALYIWKRRKGEEYYQSLSQFSIAQVMQLRPRGEVQLDRPGEDLTYPKLLERVLIEATCYLALATELRLLAARQDSSQVEVCQFKESQSFHLIALSILLRFLPIEIPFLKHALTSYGHHYKGQLEECPCFMTNSQLLSPILDSPLAQSNAHLQAYVKASLATQHQFAKLDSYYYNESQNNKVKKGKKSSSRPKEIAKRACLTSKQSAQKTPIGTSPSRLSPLRSRLSKREEKHPVSARASIAKINSPKHKKITSVLDEYFSPESNRKKLLSKGSKNKQNKIRIAKLTSPSAWQGANISNKPSLSRGKAESKLLGVKSPSKRPQVVLGKSKKKVGSTHYYY